MIQFHPKHFFLHSFMHSFRHSVYGMELLFSFEQVDCLQKVLLQLVRSEIPAQIVAGLQ